MTTIHSTYDDLPTPQAFLIQLTLLTWLCWMESTPTELLPDYFVTFVTNSTCTTRRIVLHKPCPIHMIMRTIQDILELVVNGDKFENFVPIVKCLDIVQINVQRKRLKHFEIMDDKMMIFVLWYSSTLLPITIWGIDLSIAARGPHPTMYTYNWATAHTHSPFLLPICYITTQVLGLATFCM